MRKSRSGFSAGAQDAEAAYDVFVETLQSSSCFICYDAMDAVPPRGKHVPIVLPCGHVFGHSCYLQWTKEFDRSKRYANYDLNSTPCPSCRRKIPDASIRSVPYVTPRNQSAAANPQREIAGRGAGESTVVKQEPSAGGESNLGDDTVDYHRAVLRSLRATWRELSAKQNKAWDLYKPEDDAIRLRHMCLLPQPHRYAAVDHLGSDIFIGLTVASTTLERRLHFFTCDGRFIGDADVMKNFAGASGICSMAVTRRGEIGISSASPSSIVLLYSSGLVGLHHVELAASSITCHHVKRISQMSPLMVAGQHEASTAVPTSIIAVMTGTSSGRFASCLASYFHPQANSSTVVFFRPDGGFLLHGSVALLGRHVDLLQAVDLGNDELVVLFTDPTDGGESWSTIHLRWKAGTSDPQSLRCFPAGSARFVRTSAALPGLGSCGEVRVAFYINDGLRLALLDQFETDMAAAPTYVPGPGWESGHVAQTAPAAASRPFVFAPSGCPSGSKRLASDFDIGGSLSSQPKTKMPRTSSSTSSSGPALKQRRSEAPRVFVVIDSDDEDGVECLAVDDDDVEVIGQRSNNSFVLSPLTAKESVGTADGVLCGTVFSGATPSTSLLTAVSEKATEANGKKVPMSGVVRAVDTIHLDLPLSTITDVVPGSSCLVVISDEHLRFYA